MERKKLLRAGFSLSISMVLLLSATIFMAANAPQASTQPKTLEIGALLNVTGWFSDIDTVEEAEVQAVAKMINAGGGITINGQKYQIKIVTEDGKSTFDGIAAAANKFAYDHQVKFVVGPTGFFSTASSRLFEQNKILHVSGYCTTQPGELDASTPYGFLGHNCSLADSIAAIKAMKREFPKVKRIAIAIPDDGSVPHLIPKAKKEMELQGYTVVGGTVAFPGEMEDFSPIAAKLNAIKDADAYISINGSPAHLGNLLKGLRELGNYKPYITSSKVSCDVIAAISGKTAATNAISLAIIPRAPGNPPLLDKISDSLRAQFEKQKVIYLMTGNSLWVLSRVIEAAKSLDPSVVKAKWESMDTVETLYGTGILSGDKTYGIKHHAIGHPMPYVKLIDSKVSFGGWVDVGAIP